ncbi:MAG: hypothetical protein FJ042_05355 [Candidatus Cloacimonetes bacterium]|nr:hypothetical protein [Candidatus Cloacimonadota bacterium]
MIKVLFVCVHNCARSQMAEELLRKEMGALICDNRLFVKPTAGGREFLREVEEGQSYPGANMWFLIPEEDWDDTLRLMELQRSRCRRCRYPKSKANR